MSFRYGLLALTMAAVPAWAQSVISAQSGLIHYAEGRVLVDGQPVEVKVSNFPAVKEKQELRTEEGRVEVLLTPGVFLRLGENSSLRMVSNRLTDSRIEFASGSAVIEAVDLLKDNQVTVTFKDWSVALRKNGLYRFDSEPAQLMVYSGEASVATQGQVPLVLKEGRCLPYGPGQVAVKFDKEANDSLFRWAQRRADYIALANVSAARSIERSDQSWSRSGWYWNSYYGMFTFVPYRSYYTSPFGYRYWSPLEVYQVYSAYYPQPVNRGWNDGGGSLGYATVPRTYTGNSGAVAAAPSAPAAASTSAAGAASAPVSRESGQAGGRGR